MNHIQQINDIKVHESNKLIKEVILYEFNSLTNVCSLFNFQLDKMNQTHKMKGTYKMKDIKDMNHKEKDEYINELLNEIHSLNEINETNETLIAELQSKLEASSKDGRKSQVLNILREYRTISILEISKLLSISTKNVSSQLTYLRSDGYMIFTDHKGRKMLIEDQVTNDVQQTNDDSNIDDDSSVEDES